MNFLLIPARMESSRFPDKPLAPINGVPMVGRVYDRCCQVTEIDWVRVVTNSRAVWSAMLGSGRYAVLDEYDALNGTERLAHYADKFLDDKDFVVNVQGDEPLMEPVIPQRVLFNLKNKPEYVWTAARKLNQGELENKDVVKARENNGFLCDFSREGKSWHNVAHIGVYGYTVKKLREYLQRQATAEEIESGLEQHRWFTPLACVMTDYNGIGVDRPEHIALVEARLSKKYTEYIESPYPMFPGLY